MHVATDRLDARSTARDASRSDDGSYQLELATRGKASAASSTFRLEKPPIRHGDDGVVRGNAGEEMFYYFIPRCGVTGCVTHRRRGAGGQQGQGWYDHEFGGYVARARAAAQQASRPSEGAGIRDLGWNWTAIQLDDGTDLTAYEHRRRPHDGDRRQVDDHDRRRRHARSITDVDVRAARRRGRRSARSTTYPTAWRLTAPSIGLESRSTRRSTIRSSSPCISQARVLGGPLHGAAARSAARRSRAGVHRAQRLREHRHARRLLLRRRQGGARARPRRVLPLEPTYEEMRDLIASEELAHYMDGVDTPAMVAHADHADPRDGRSRRQVVALVRRARVLRRRRRRLAQVHPVARDARADARRLADHRRRPGPVDGAPRRPGCHVTHGEPIAINAGTAAYFLTQNLLRSDELDRQAEAAHLRPLLRGDARRPRRPGDRSRRHGAADARRRRDAATSASSSAHARLPSPEDGGARGLPRAHGRGRRRRQRRADRGGRRVLRGGRPRVPDHGRRPQPARLQGQPQAARRGHRERHRHAAGRERDGAGSAARSASGCGRRCRASRQDPATVAAAVELREGVRRDRCVRRQSARPGREAGGPRPSRCSSRR